MNVFRLDENPEKSARFHCDQHVNKMLVESGQILSTALRLNGCSFDYLYRSTHCDHPIVQWVSDSIEAYRWVLSLSEALYKEKEFRFGGTHKTYEKVISRLPESPSDFLPSNPSDQPLAMPESYQGDDSVCSYRRYYREDKGFASWDQGRECPDWM